LQCDRQGELAGAQILVHACLGTQHQIARPVRVRGGLPGHRGRSPPTRPSAGTIRVRTWSALWRF